MGLFSRKENKQSQAARSDTIDLRAQPSPATLEFGLPTPCPTCGSHGYLDGIDIRRRIMYQHCRSCFEKWETSEADLAARGA